MSYFFAIVMDHPDKPGDDIKASEMIFHLRTHHVFQTSLLLTRCYRYAERSRSITETPPNRTFKINVLTPLNARFF